MGAAQSDQPTVKEGKPGKDTDANAKGGQESCVSFHATPTQNLSLSPCFSPSFVRLVLLVGNDRDRGFVVGIGNNKDSSVVGLLSCFACPRCLDEWNQCAVP